MEEVRESFNLKNTRTQRERGRSDGKKNVCGGKVTLVPNVIAVDNLYNPVWVCIMKNEETGRSVTKPCTQSKFKFILTPVCY